MATNKTQHILLKIEHNKYCYKLNTKNIDTNKIQQI